MKRLETYRDIFKQFSIIDLEKTEHVLSALQEYTKIHRADGWFGIPIEKLKCTDSDVKIALPVLVGIKNILFPSKEETPSDRGEGLLQVYMPTQEVTLTRDNKLTGLSFNDIVEKSLEEIQLYISKNKVSKNGKITLTLSKIGLRNDQNGKVYSIKGKRLRCIEILHKNSPLTGEQISIETEQNKKDVWDAIEGINETAKLKLDLEEDIIVSADGGYLFNPLYKIKIPKIK